MAGSRKWLRAFDGEKCEVCEERLSHFAIKEIHFELMPRQEGVGYGSIKTTLTAHCPTCGNGWSLIANDISAADMKSGIGWLVGRTVLHINPFTKQPYVPPETMEVADDSCTCEFDETEPDRPSEELAEKNDDEPEGGGGVATGELPSSKDSEELPPPRSGSKRGRLLTQPSVRSCCPPTPITDDTVSAAKRAFRCYSYQRTAPSFRRLMMKFGVKVDESGDPVEGDCDE